MTLARALLGLALFAGCSRSELPPAHEPRHAPPNDSFAADVVIWADICPDECKPSLSYRLDRKQLSAEVGVVGPDDAVAYAFLGDLLRPPTERARVAWALEAVPSVIKSLPTRELGKQVLYTTGGTYLEVQAQGHTWKVVLWDRDPPPEAGPLVAFVRELRASLR